MNFYIDVLKKYAVFSGRARRKEYWMFMLVSFLIALALAFIDGVIGSAGIIGAVYTLAVLVPSIAVTIRRLHDIGRSGWWMLIVLIPLLGAIVFLVFMCQDGKPENDFGENPKMATA